MTLLITPLVPLTLRGRLEWGNLPEGEKSLSWGKRGLGSRLRPDVVGMLDEIGMSYVVTVHNPLSPPYLKGETGMGKLA
jgi:hypothetical protein